MKAKGLIIAGAIIAFLGFLFLIASVIFSIIPNPNPFASGFFIWIFSVIIILFSCVFLFIEFMILFISRSHLYNLSALFCIILILFYMANCYVVLPSSGVTIVGYIFTFIFLVLLLFLAGNDYDNPIWLSEGTCRKLVIICIIITASDFVIPKVLNVFTNGINILLFGPGFVDFIQFLLLHVVSIYYFITLFIFIIILIVSFMKDKSLYQASHKLK